ncbi:MAG: family N-acetyltransferase [Parachlamydiales bacterium]|nr:family N-acetyltransferase [Parachlamydiales bacterium]
MALVLWPHHSREELTKEFDRIINTPKEIGFICKKNEKAIGFIIVSLRFGHIAGVTSKPVGYVEGIYVKEDHRKLGVARKLYEVGEQWAKNNGCTQVGSDTWDWNDDSIVFHEKLDHKKVCTLVCFIKNIDELKT